MCCISSSSSKEVCDKRLYSYFAQARGILILGRFYLDMMTMFTRSEPSIGTKFRNLSV